MSNPPKRAVDVNTSSSLVATEAAAESYWNYSQLGTKHLRNGRDAPALPSEDWTETLRSPADTPLPEEE